MRSYDIMSLYENQILDDNRCKTLDDLSPYPTKKDTY